jgi:hypothetical protein
LCMVNVSLLERSVGVGWCVRRVRGFVCEGQCVTSYPQIVVLGFRMFEVGVCVHHLEAGSASCIDRLEFQQPVSFI